MSVILSKKEFEDLRRLGKCLRIYRGQIDEYLAILDQLELRVTSQAPAGTGTPKKKRETKKEDRKAKYKIKLHIKP